MDEREFRRVFRSAAESVYGVSAQQVATSVAEKVRYAVRRDPGAIIERLTVRVDGKAMAADSSSASESPST